MKKLIILLIIGLLILSVVGCNNTSQKEVEKKKEEKLELQISREVYIKSGNVVRITHGLNTENYTSEVQILKNDSWVEWENYEIGKNTLIIENTTDEGRDFNYSIYK